VTGGAGHLLGLDLGTTSVRALALDADGAVRGRAARRLATRCPGPGRVEQDPEQMAALAREVMRAALEAGGLAAGDVCALGITTQRGSVVAWDARTLRPLAPAIGWQDRRATARALELLRDGIPVHPLASATKLEWWLRHEPAVAAAARTGRLRLGTPDAWLGARLGDGASRTDASQACCTGLYDLRAGGWSERALARLGIEPAWLPEIVPSDAAAGALPRRVLGGELPIAARLGDQQAAAVAQGLAAAGDAKLTLGTSAMLDVHAGEAAPRPRAGSYPLVLWHRSGADRAFCHEATVVTAGAAVDWWVELGLLSAPAALDAEARRGRPGACFVPALQGLGSPRFADGARALLGGLTRDTGRADLARALVEGLAHRGADLCETLAPLPEPLPVDGGLARCDLLLQRISDFSGLALVRAAESETTALGAALLAASGVGLATAGDTRARALGAATRFRPALEEAARRAERARWASAVARSL